MSKGSWLEVIDKDGWQKEYPLEKNITYIGSHPRNDVILQDERGVGVASLHAQLIAGNGEGTYQLVNLADTVIRLGPDEQRVDPRSVIRIGDGHRFTIGDFTLIFRGQGGLTSSGGAVQSVTGQGFNRSIGLSLTLPHTHLAPNQTLDGFVTVHNLGDKTGVKFVLTLEGLDEPFFDLEPGPLLSSGAEKEVLFRLFHRGAQPGAGSYEITIRATAPKAYPAQEATVSQVIEILPFYQHALLLGSKPAPVVKTAEIEPLSRKEEGRSAEPETAAQPALTSDSEEDWWVAPVEIPPQPPPISGGEPLGSPLPRGEGLGVREKKGESSPDSETDSPESATAKGWWGRLTGRFSGETKRDEPAPAASETQPDETPPTVTELEPVEIPPPVPVQNESSPVETESPPEPVSETAADPVIAVAQETPAPELVKADASSVSEPVVETIEEERPGRWLETEKVEAEAVESVPVTPEPEVPKEESTPAAPESEQPEPERISEERQPAAAASNEWWGETEEAEVPVLKMKATSTAASPKVQEKPTSTVPPEVEDWFEG